MSYSFDQSTTSTTQSDGALFVECELSSTATLDARRRLENKLEDLALQRDIKEFDFDI